MVKTADLVPFSSGSASIGVEQLGVTGFGAITPYNHIHFVSGIIHDPVAGSSGVIRYAQGEDRSLAIGLPITLRVQGTQSHVSLSVDGGLSFPLELGATPKLNRQAATIRTPDSTTNLYVHSSGTALFYAEGNTTIGSTNALLLSSNLSNIAINTPKSLNAIVKTDTTFYGGDSLGASEEGGQITLQPFNASGQLKYLFGPYQSWYIKTTDDSTGGPFSDGFWPIPHSGYIDTMILRAIKTKAITIERPAVNNDLTLWYTNEPITITEIESVCRGSFDASGLFAIRYASSRAAAGTEVTSTAITCTSRSTGQITSSFAAPEIPADNWVWIGVSGVSGVATSQLHVTIQYK